MTRLRYPHAPRPSLRTARHIHTHCVARSSPTPRAQAVRIMSGIARHVRACGTHLRSTRSTSASVGTIIDALRDRVLHRRRWARCGCGAACRVERGEGCGGRGGCRSGRSAADPSPPVLGPSACSRAPAPAAIWRPAVASHARDRTASSFVHMARSAMFACVCTRVCVLVDRRLWGAGLHVCRPLKAYRCDSMRRKR